MNGKLYAFALGTLVLTACSNDENLPGDGADRSAALFSATIDVPATRATNTAWEAGDEIGISGDTGTTQHTNVCHFTDGDGRFEPKNGSEKIYFEDDSEVTFTAYWPWNDLKEATSVTADTRRQAEQKQFDFLWAQAKGSQSGNEVAFRFAHKMAKVAFTIKCGAGVSYEEVKAAALSLEGFRHEGSFDVTTGDAAATGKECTTWTFAGSTTAADNAPFTTDDQAHTVTYNLILFPQAFAGPLPFRAELAGGQTLSATLDFTDANGTKDENPKNEWVPGRRYDMGIVLNKTGISVEGSTVMPWEKTNGGNVDAKE